MTTEQDAVLEPEAHVESKPKRRGRPPGKSNVSKEVVLVRPAVCSRCKSTRRTAYRKAFAKQRSGYTADGVAYSQIVYRDCRCADCGHPRREAHFQNG